MTSAALHEPRGDRGERVVAKRLSRLYKSWEALLMTWVEAALGDLKQKFHRERGKWSEWQQQVCDMLPGRYRTLIYVMATRPDWIECLVSRMKNLPGTTDKEVLTQCALELGRHTDDCLVEITRLTLYWIGEGQLATSVQERYLKAVRHAGVVPGPPVLYRDMQKKDWRKNACARVRKRWNQCHSHSPELPLQECCRQLRLLHKLRLIKAILNAVR